MTEDTQPQAPGFDRQMLEALVCPVTHTTLHYDAARQELVSRTAGLAFPIRQGIPIMLIDEARQIKANGDGSHG
ncbi:Trm112 family protein [Paracoccus sp. M683]|uniref:Trm112 family protein n=1 Tax=Paracoccus sp. M683 TaxID=2594268 RepID=UPI00117C0E9F|nr:Trm112 family protein [Paracoccus sp. M683]TRW98625.1 Trm112 family protein [Paracoccus sp. M683]